MSSILAPHCGHGGRSGLCGEAEICCGWDIDSSCYRRERGRVSQSPAPSVKPLSAMATCCNVLPSESDQNRPLSKMPHSSKRADPERLKSMFLTGFALAEVEEQRRKARASTPAERDRGDSAGHGREGDDASRPRLCRQRRSYAAGFIEQYRRAAGYVDAR